MPDDRIARLKAAAMSSRSNLYRWMRENHDAFAAALAEAGRPNWDAITKELAKDGFTDSDGKSPASEVVRQTWWKVRKAVEAARAKAAHSPASASHPAVQRVAPSPSVPDSNAVSGAPGRPGETAADPAAPKFRPAKLRSAHSKDTW